MNERSFIVPAQCPPNAPSAILDRRQQILDAAMLCFAKRGFHQTSMHDISAEAGISVGLIYRYFKNKEEVIAALATEHKKNIAELLERAGRSPDPARGDGDSLHFTLLRALAANHFRLCGRSLRRGEPQPADRKNCAQRHAKPKPMALADLIARSPEGNRLAPWLDATGNRRNDFCLE